MSRYTGPRVKKMRAVGIDLPGLSRKSIDRRPFPPGDHGSARKQRKSDYGLQLMEKQKIVLNYGITERQMRRLVREARSDSGPSGDKLFEFLERRLDNVVFRAGFAPTIPAARQLVSHGHFLLNNRRVNIPSIRVKLGDVIQLRERSRTMSNIVDSMASSSLQMPSWIKLDAAEFSCSLLELPEGVDSAPFSVDVQKVIEFYSRSL